MFFQAKPFPGCARPHAWRIVQDHREQRLHPLGNAAIELADDQDHGTYNVEAAVLMLSRFREAPADGSVRSASMLADSRNLHAGSTTPGHFESSVPIAGAAHETQVGVWLLMLSATLSHAARARQSPPRPSPRPIRFREQLLAGTGRPRSRYARPPGLQPHIHPASRPPPERLPPPGSRGQTGPRESRERGRVPAPLCSGWQASRARQRHRHGRSPSCPTPLHRGSCPRVRGSVM